MQKVGAKVTALENDKAKCLEEKAAGGAQASTATSFVMGLSAGALVGAATILFVTRKDAK
jgi:formate/nitrite transporter FocA (FNT family)